MILPSLNRALKGAKPFSDLSMDIERSENILPSLNEALKGAKPLSHLQFLIIC